MNKKLIISLTFILFVSCNKVKYQLENKNEKNYSFETAQYISKDGINGEIEAGKKDYYYFGIEKTQIIDFYISNSTKSHIAMTLYDNEKNIIKVISEPDYIVNASNTNEMIKLNKDIQIMKGMYFEQHNDMLSSTLPKYYITIESREKTEYSLILQKREYKETDEKEPNDKIGNAQIIEVNSDNRLYTIEGYYSQTYNPALTSGDLKNMEIDAYKITNGSFNIYSISIELSGVPSIDASVRLYDYKGNWITIKDINNTGDGETIDKLILYPYSSYYFVLSANNTVLNIPYRLNIIAKPYDKYTENEPNNKSEEAQNIEFNKTYKGAIDYSFDRDYFSFNIPIQSSIKLKYFLIDSQAVNISVSNNIYGKIKTMPQTDDENIFSLPQGKYYLIFERDLTKEAWQKGISKARNYEFNLSVSNEMSMDYNYGYYDYKDETENIDEYNYYYYNEESQKEFEENLENNFNDTNNKIEEDYNSDYYYYYYEDESDNYDYYNEY